MENKMGVFVGMLKYSPNVFVMGELIESDEKYWMLKNAVRVFEVPTAEQRVGYQFHPDPYFTTEKEVRARNDEFLIHRIETDPEDKMLKEYKAFLTNMRMQKAGLVPGVQTPPKNLTGDLMGGRNAR